MKHLLLALLLGGVIFNINCGNDLLVDENSPEFYCDRLNNIDYSQLTETNCVFIDGEWRSCGVRGDIERFVDSLFCNQKVIAPLYSWKGEDSSCDCSCNRFSVSNYSSLSDNIRKGCFLLSYDLDEDPQFESCKTLWESERYFDSLTCEGISISTRWTSDCEECPD